MTVLAQYSQIWLVQFALTGPRGEPLTPIALAALELRSGELVCLDSEELSGCTSSPLPSDHDCLVILFEANVQVAGFLAMGWAPPAHLVDLYAEHRCLTNGEHPLAGNHLMGVMVSCGLPARRYIGQGVFGDAERSAASVSSATSRLALESAKGFVHALASVWRHMRPAIDLPRAVHRGRTMVAIARMEQRGVPVDLPRLLRIQRAWRSMRERLVAEIDRNYGVFDGTKLQPDRWAQWISEQAIPWPRTPFAKLRLDAETFRQMARAHPEVAPIRELAFSLSDLHLEKLTVGRDGRNRCRLRPFRSVTSRNQPSSAASILGPAVWIRSLIQPPAGQGLAYIDWSQQEFGIGAALSGDPAMQAAYQSGDPYLAFAIQSGAAPEGATRATHASARERAKQCVLGVQYAMGAETLSQRLGMAPAYARDLLKAHRRTYRRFWSWSDASVDVGMLRGRLWTVFGWGLHVGQETKSATIRNFPMQANGAEMLRLACTLATEAGVAVCAPLHDALLIEAPLESLDEAIDTTQQAMASASRLVLGGFELRSDVRTIRHPDRFTDSRGTRMWDAVLRCLDMEAAHVG